MQGSKILVFTHGSNLARCSLRTGSAPLPAQCPSASLGVSTSSSGSLRACCCLCCRRSVSPVCSVFCAIFVMLNCSAGAASVHCTFWPFHSGRPSRAWFAPAVLGMVFHTLTWLSVVVCLSVCLPVRLSVCVLFVCFVVLSVCLSVCPWVYLSIHPSIYLSLSLTIHKFRPCFGSWASMACSSRTEWLSW